MVLRLQFYCHFSGPGKAIGPVCVSVCPNNNYELNDIRYAGSS